MTTIVHVNKQNIAMNAKDGRNRPTLIVRSGRNGTSRYARAVEGEGKFRFVTGEGQLTCGARVWFETEAPVTLVDEMSFSEARATGL